MLRRCLHDHDGLKYTNWWTPIEKNGYSTKICVRIVQALTTMLVSFAKSSELPYERRACGAAADYYGQAKLSVLWSSDMERLAVWKKQVWGSSILPKKYSWIARRSNQFAAPISVEVALFVGLTNIGERASWNWRQRRLLGLQALIRCCDSWPWVWDGDAKICRIALAWVSARPPCADITKKQKSNIDFLLDRWTLDIVRNRCDHREWTFYGNYTTIYAQGKRYTG